MKHPCLAIIFLMPCVALLLVLPDQASGQSKTWSEVDNCYAGVDATCKQKLPDTPFKERRCYENQTVQGAFNEAAPAFEQCIDEQLHTGERCVRLHPRPPRHPQRPFTKCWNDERNQCTEGCLELQGSKIKSYLQCSKTAFAKARQLWQDCIKHHQKRPSAVDTLLSPPQKKRGRQLKQSQEDTLYGRRIYIRRTMGARDSDEMLI